MSADNSKFFTVERTIRNPMQAMCGYPVLYRARSNLTSWVSSWTESREHAVKLGNQHADLFREVQS